MEIKSIPRMKETSYSKMLFPRWVSDCNGTNNQRRVRFGFLIVFFLFFFRTSLAQDFHWFQLMGGDQMWFRFVGEEQTECPSVVVNGVKHRLSEHRAKDADFPLSCFYKLNLNKLPQSLFFEGKEITPKFNRSKVKKIGVIGDTGCRVKLFLNQDCEKEWFFEDIVKQIVQHRPDMVIHVGDYVYREKKSNVVWETWKADFFLPAKELLHSNVPLLLVRGNHESCARGGRGWFSFFAHSNGGCQDYGAAPYSISVNGLDLLVTDSVDEQNLLTDLKEINSSINERKTWILTHRPLVMRNRSTVPVGHILVIEKLKKEIELFISGHVHAVQFLKLGGRAQLIAGNGGAMLSTILAGNFIDSRVEYGFTMIDFIKGDVKIINYDRFNREMMSNYLRK